MLIKDLSNSVNIGYWLIGIFIIVMIVERWRIENGRQMLIDRFITFMEDVHHRTAPPKDCEIYKVWEYALSDKVKVRKLRFHGQASDNREVPEKEK